MASSSWPVLQGQQFMVSKTPMFKTRVKEAVSGRKLTSPLWTYPRWEFKAAYEFLRDRPATLPELDMMVAFLGEMQGQSGTFNFLDPLDNVITNQTIGTGDGANRVFQLARTTSATIGGITHTFTEPVFAVSGTPTVTVNGVSKTYAMGANGLITMTAAPAAASTVAWTGSMMFLCRFQDDKWDIPQMCKDLWSISGVNFESVKL